MYSIKLKPKMQNANLILNLTLMLALTLTPCPQELTGARLSVPMMTDAQALNQTLARTLILVHPTPKFGTIHPHSSWT